MVEFGEVLLLFVLVLVVIEVKQSHPLFWPLTHVPNNKHLEPSLIADFGLVLVLVV